MLSGDSGTQNGHSRKKKSYSGGESYGAIWFLRPLKRCDRGHDVRPADLLPGRSLAGEEGKKGLPSTGTGEIRYWPGSAGPGLRAQFVGGAFFQPRRRRINTGRMGEGSDSNNHRPFHLQLSLTSIQE